MERKMCVVQSPPQWMVMLNCSLLYISLFAERLFTFIHCDGFCIKTVKLASDRYTSCSCHEENDRECLIPLQLCDVGFLDEDVDQGQVVPGVEVELVLENWGVGRSEGNKCISLILCCGKSAKQNTCTLLLNRPIKNYNDVSLWNS